jgi:hypothetical protein
MNVLSDTLGTSFNFLRLKGGLGNSRASYFVVRNQM